MFGFWIRKLGENTNKVTSWTQLTSLGGLRNDIILGLEGFIKDHFDYLITTPLWNQGHFATKMTILVKSEECIIFIFENDHPKLPSIKGLNHNWVILEKNNWNLSKNPTLWLVQIYKWMTKWDELDFESTTSIRHRVKMIGLKG